MRTPTPKNSGVFYVYGRCVKRDILEIKKNDGTSDFEMGFDVCTVSDALPEATAVMIANCLNDSMGHLIRGPKKND